MHIVTQRLKETVQNRHNLSEIAEEIAANRARMQKKIAANKAQMQKKSPLTRRKKEYRRDKEKSPLIIAKMERSNAVHLGEEKNPFFSKGKKSVLTRQH